MNLQANEKLKENLNLFFQAKKFSLSRKISQQQIHVMKKLWNCWISGSEMELRVQMKKYHGRNSEVQTIKTRVFYCFLECWQCYGALAEENGEKLPFWLICFVSPKVCVTEGFFRIISGIFHISHWNVEPKTKMYEIPIESFNNEKFQSLTCSVHTLGVDESNYCCCYNWGILQIYCGCWIAILYQFCSFAASFPPKTP